MNWIKALFAGIAAALGSLFGMHAQPAAVSPAIPMDTYSAGDFSLQYPAGWAEQNQGSMMVFESASSTQAVPVNLAVSVLPSTAALNAASQIAQFSQVPSLHESSLDIGPISAAEFTDTTSRLTGSFIVFEHGGYIYNLAATDVDPATAQDFYQSFTFAK